MTTSSTRCSAAPSRGRARGMGSCRATLWTRSTRARGRACPCGRGLVTVQVLLLRERTDRLDRADLPPRVILEPLTGELRRVEQDDVVAVKLHRVADARL